MTRILFKKQMMELFSFFWLDKKKNKKRTGISLVFSILLYLALFGVMALVFYILADMLCEPLVMAEVGWLYFAMTGLVGVALGAFGSIFNTYAGLYLAKDNSFLLAMPIPPSRILTVRLSGVYAMGLLYELLVMIPVLIKYFMIAKPGVLTIVSAIWVTFVLSVFVLILSAVLGWVVALISAKTKHKSLITVALSLVFICGYYYLYGMAAGMLQDIVMNPQDAGNFLKGSFSPLYHMGLAAEGNMMSLLFFTVVVFVMFGIVYLILAKSYTKIITTNKGEAKVQYKEQRAEVRYVGNALLGKEFRRFLGSPNYMLNCGLGILIMIVAAAALLIKADAVMSVLLLMFPGSKDMLLLIAAAAICLLASMNDMTAPSVSLEGKNLWIVQAFPVSGRQVLMAKLKLQLILTLTPAALLTASVELVLKPSPTFAFLIPLAVAVFILFMAAFGLFMNLKMPNLTWTSEIVPIKQSVSVMIVLFGGWAVIVAFGGAYYLLMNILSPAVYLLLSTLLLLAVSAVLLGWIRNKGARIFETL